MKHYTANPSENTAQWFVWNVYDELPPKPIFFGSMEDAWLVAGALNVQHIQQRVAAGDFDGF